MFFFSRQGSHAARTDLFLGQQFVRNTGCLRSTVGAGMSSRRLRGARLGKVESGAIITEALQPGDWSDVSKTLEGIWLNLGLFCAELLLVCQERKEKRKLYGPEHLRIEWVLAPPSLFATNFSCSIYSAYRGGMSSLA